MVIFKRGKRCTLPCACNVRIKLRTIILEITIQGRIGEWYYSFDHFLLCHSRDNSVKRIVLNLRVEPLWLQKTRMIAQNFPPLASGGSWTSHWMETCIVVSSSMLSYVGVTPAQERTPREYQRKSNWLKYWTWDKTYKIKFEQIIKHWK